MLKLNVKKSKFIIFFKHPKIISNFSITINNSTIEQVDHFNFLGVTLDQNITWNPHVDKVSIKISRVTGLLRKLQHYFPKQILITIYNSLIHSHLMYGLLVWGFQSMCVEKLQKKAIRVLANRSYISHTTPIFKELRILKITDLYHVQPYKLHYKNINNLPLDTLESLLSSLPCMETITMISETHTSDSNDQTRFFCSIN